MSFIILSQYFVKSVFYIFSSSEITSDTTEYDNDRVNDTQTNFAKKTNDKRVKLNEKTGEIESDNDLNDIVEESEINNVINNVNECLAVDNSKTRIILNEITGEFHEVEEVDEEIEEEVKKKGKKRSRKPQNWKKNVAKIENVKNHVRREIPKCRCKCKEKLSEKEIDNIFNKFINLSSHTNQNIYLQGCLQEIEKSVSFICEKRKFF